VINGRRRRAQLGRPPETSQGLLSLTLQSGVAGAPHRAQP
jgi:hypothetical protein